MTHINETLFIGLGGVGSQLIGPFAAALHNDVNCWGDEDHKGKPARPKMVLCDGDKYEEKNLKNQCITRADLGENKAEVAATAVCEMVQVEAWDKYIGGPLEIQSWLVSQRTRQDKRIKAGLFSGVALIVTAADNPHLRSHIFKALREVPNVSVLVIDPSNGAGDDAHVVDVVTYLRIFDGTQTIEPWPDHITKWPAQYEAPKGIPDHERADCMEKAVSEPQLRTANMMAATLAYDCLVRWLDEGGMAEGYHADVEEWTVGKVGIRMPTGKEMAQ